MRGAIIFWIALWLPAHLQAQPVRLSGPSTPAGPHSFGHAVDIEGDHIAIGNPTEESHAGAVYVYYRDPLMGWQQQARLIHTGRTPGDAFGHAVALSGPFLLVGAPEKGETGSAYVFSRDPLMGWQQQAHLTSHEPAIDDRFGHSVAVSGIYAFVGAPLDDTPAIDAGSAHIFVFEGDQWRYLQQLDALPSNTGDQFGSSLALRDDLALVGIPYGDEPRGKDAGLVHVYERNTGPEWSTRATLQARDARNNNLFGASVALGSRQHLGRDVDIAVIGAPGSGPQQAGAAYLITNIDETWTETTRFTPQNGTRGDRFGEVVATENNTSLVGVTRRNIASVLTVSPTGNWQETDRLTAFELSSQACFACAVALDGNHIVIGAPEEHNAGAVYVYNRSDTETHVDFPEHTLTSMTLLNYPNPFRHTTTIVFEIPSHEHVRLTVHDALGRRVDLLLDQEMHGGRHKVQWTSQALPTGAYTYRLAAGGRTQTGHMTYIR